MPRVLYNAHHSPLGAFATCTLGAAGASGGIAAERETPARENLFVALERADAPDTWDAFPWFDQSEGDKARFVLEDQAPAHGAAPVREARLQAWPENVIERRLGPCLDVWRAGDLTLRIASPLPELPDPDAAPESVQRTAYRPAIVWELVVDNTRGTRERRCCVGWQPGDPYASARHLDPARAGGPGIAGGLRAGLVSADADAVSASGFTIRDILCPEVPGMLDGERGRVRGLLLTVRAGERRVWRLAVGWFQGGIVTAGLACRYWYARFWDDLEAVLADAAANHAAILAQAERDEARLDRPGLGEARRWQWAMALRSWAGATQLFEHAGRPLWAVNEGEYRMLNTLDLTVDHLFWELRNSPWTVRNALDLFADRYRYECGVVFPGEPRERPGGVSFCHDMGVGNHFTPAGRSSYEAGGLTGCFSYMTAEQLVNWSLCACAYLHRTGDAAWRARRAGLLAACVDSVLNRCRGGIVAADSTRCAGGAEITTYDSLDTSLGQARNNGYLAVKTWACHLALAAQLRALGDETRATRCEEAARAAAATVTAAVTPDGTLPALIGEPSQARIVPVIEGLVFPRWTGRDDALAPAGEFGPFLRVLRAHLDAVLRPGLCLFPDGGWKLSSTSINSWLSKIYLCQHVAADLLGLPAERVFGAADEAHRAWLLREENVFWCWSDQMHAGVAKGSRYYPRGVTAALWAQ